MDSMEGIDFIIAGFFIVMLVMFILILIMLGLNDRGTKEEREEYQKPFPLYKGVTVKQYLNGSKFESINNQIKELVAKEKILFETDSYLNTPDEYKIPIHIELLKKRYDIINQAEGTKKIYGNRTYTQYYIHSLLSLSNSLHNYSDHAFQSSWIKSNKYDELFQDYKKLTDLYLNNKEELIELEFSQYSFNIAVLRLFPELYAENQNKDPELLTEIFKTLDIETFISDVLQFNQELIQKQSKLVQKENKLQKLETLREEYSKINDLT